MFDEGPSRFDGIEIWAVRRNAQDGGPLMFDSFDDGFVFMQVDIVPTYHIAGAQGRHEFAEYKVLEVFDLDAATDSFVRAYPIGKSQRRYHRDTFSLGKGLFRAKQRRAALRPPTSWPHAWMHPRFIDEY